jgi:hypothetical protein
VERGQIKEKAAIAFIVLMKAMKIAAAGDDEDEEEMGTILIDLIFFLKRKNRDY